MMSRLSEKFSDILLYSGKSFLLKHVQLKPIWANVRVTENCDSRCITCYAWKNNSQNELTTGEMKDVLHQLWGVHKKFPRLIYTCNHMLEYARSYLKGKKRYNFHCVHGFKMIYLGAHGEVYPGCWMMEPLGNIRRNKLSDLVGSKRHKEIAQKMYMMKCPGCTNRYEVNVSIKHLLSHSLFCQRK